MVIVFVIDSYGEFSNGTTITAKRSKAYLESMGHTVRVVSIDKSTEEDFFHLDEREIPVVSYFARKQNMHFAKPNKKVLEEAFTGADVIHLFLPFKSGLTALKIAKKMKIPVTSAFHMQPEHITYGMGLDRYGGLLAWFIYKWLKFRFYKKATHIHCPSEFIRNKLVDHRYNNVFHVISNGVEDKFFNVVEREKDPEVFKILSIGRYSKEKRQDTLLKAVSYSKYKDKIEITLAGRGPKEKKLKKLAKKLNLNVKFVFLNQEELIKTINESHLYVHPAEAEIEGMSALEAIASGLVPIVAVSKQSATRQFTMTIESRYKVRDFHELSEKINYFIENPDRRVELEGKYREFLVKYKIEKSMPLLEEMFKAAISDFKRNESSRTKRGKELKKRIFKPFIKRLLGFILYYFIIFPILIPYFYLIRGVKVQGKKNVKKIKRGAITISNHVHTLDVVLNGIAVFPKKTLFTSIPANFHIPVAGRIIGLLGAPIPMTPLETKVFLVNLQEKLINGKLIHFYPEGNLVPKNPELDEFKRGAFVLAEEASVPIIPIRINFVRKHRMKFPFFFKHRLVINVGKPIYPNIFLNKREAIADLHERAFAQMELLKIPENIK